MELQSAQLTVRVNQALTLDAGWWEEEKSNQEVVRLVHLSAKTTFQQVMDYLDEQPEMPSRGLIPIREEALDKALVCSRWGTSVAMLMDHRKLSGCAGQRSPDFVHRLRRDETHQPGRFGKRGSVSGDSALCPVAKCSHGKQRPICLAN